MNPKACVFDCVKSRLSVPGWAILTNHVSEWVQNHVYYIVFDHIVDQVAVCVRDRAWSRVGRELRR